MMPFDEEELDPHGECKAEIERLRHDIERLRADLGDIEKIANIPPADDRCGSLAVRMNKVWLLARGHQQQPASEKDWAGATRRAAEQTPDPFVDAVRSQQPLKKEMNRAS